MSPTKKESFSAEEKAAMRARARELKAAAQGEEAIDAALAEMTPSDRALGKKIHAIVKETAPGLTPKTWYGMPAYANADDKVVLFFKNAGKFKERYSTLGFEGAAALDDGDMWPVVYALVTWSPAVEKKVTQLVKAAVS